MFDPSELLATMDKRISAAKEEAFSRKDILERVEKWMAACEEENWLEDYSRVSIILMGYCFFPRRSDKNGRLLL